MFTAGSKDKNLKLSAAGMRRSLVKSNGERFNFPSETEITKFINVMFLKQKSSANGTVSNRSRQVKVGSRFLDAIDLILRQKGFDVSHSEVLRLLKLDAVQTESFHPVFLQTNM